MEGVRWHTFSIPRLLWKHFALGPFFLTRFYLRRFSLIPGYTFGGKSRIGRSSMLPSRAGGMLLAS